MKAYFTHLYMDIHTSYVVHIFCQTSELCVFCMSWTKGGSMKHVWEWSLSMQSFCLSYMIMTTPIHVSYYMIPPFVHDILNITA